MTPFEIKMSSDEEMYLVEEILDQRKRKGVLHYLVRWQGFSEGHNSWEPASAVAHCTGLIEKFLTKKKSSRSKSRSRSRGRSAGKSKSRSRSRGRQSKPGTTQSHSPSRSPSHTVTQSSMSFSMEKKEASPANPEPSELRLRQKEQDIEQKSSVDEVEANATVTKGGFWERKTDIVFKPVETVKPTPSETRPVIATPRPCLAVQRVENDLKPSPKSTMSGATGGSSDDQTWIWWFADYATLAVFMLVSICVLFFSLERFSGMIPSADGLRLTLDESYSALLRILRRVFNETAATGKTV